MDFSRPNRHHFSGLKGSYMYRAAITGTGVFTPAEIITNAELVAAFNAYADKYNAEHAAAITAGNLPAKAHSSVDFIVAGSTKLGCLTPTACTPTYAPAAMMNPA